MFRLSRTASRSLLRRTLFFALTIASATFLSSCFIAEAQFAPDSAPGCQYNSTPVTLSNSQVARFQCDPSGYIKVTLSGTGTGNVNVSQWAGVALGAPSAYGTAPGAVTVPGVNAFVTNAVTLGPTTPANSVPIVAAPAVLGSYCMAVKSSTMAAGLAGGSPIVSFRYGGSALALVRSVEISMGDTATAFTAGVFTFDLFAARSFSVSDSGGNAATLTGNNGKLRTSFATTAVSDFRAASTATLTAGTRTLDATPLGSATSSDPATAGQAPWALPVSLFRSNIGESPEILANNEGFVVQATVPATGTWSFSAKACWDEVSAF